MESEFHIFAKQREAWRKLNDKGTNEIMYGGGARGGKSYLGCGWVTIQALTKPGSKWLVAREEMTKLRDTTLLSFFQVANILQAKQEYTFNATSTTAVFANGSIIFFREIKFIPSDPQFDRLGSYDLTGCFIDEAQQIHPKAVSVLRGRFSTLTGPGWQTVPKMLFTCNPAKNWIYTEFYKPFKENRLPAGRAFIPSLATDNPFISQEYIDFLRQSDKVTVERLLHGNFEYDDDPTALMGRDSILDIFRNQHVPAGLGYITADIARMGGDKIIIRAWSGWRCVETVKLTKQLTPVTAAAILRLAIKHQVPMSRCVVDEDGVGGGVLDQLPGAKGFLNGSSAIKVEGEKQNYENLKTQCSYRVAKRVNEAGIWVVNASDEEKEQLADEMEQVKSRDADKDAVFRIQPKVVMAQSLGRSPDWWDALMMREYFELAGTYRGLL